MDAGPGGVGVAGHDRCEPLTRPRVGITVGDPAGIGPEISLKAAAHADVLAICEPVLYGPTSAAELAGFAIGQISAKAGQTAYDAILDAVADAQAGRIDAVATAPINKEAFAAAGVAPTIGFEIGRAHV